MKYTCEICGEPFSNEQKCLEHENNHVPYRQVRRIGLHVNEENMFAGKLIMRDLKASDANLDDTLLMDPGEELNEVDGTYILCEPGKECKAVDKLAAYVKKRLCERHREMNEKYLNTIAGLAESVAAFKRRLADGGPK